MMPRKKIGNKGMALVELIIAVAILGLVLSMAYGLMNYSRLTLSNSNDYYDIQNDIRLTASYLTKEVRFATKLNIVAAADFESNTNYDYFKIENGSLVHAKYNSGISAYEEKTIGQFVSAGDSLFSKVNADTLRINLAASEDGKDYNISTDIILENFPLISDALAIGGLSTGTAIQYTNEEPYAAASPAGGEEEEEETEEPEESTALVSSIIVTSENNASEMTKKSTLKMFAGIVPDNAVKAVTWSVTSSSGKASISASGVLSAGNKADTVTVRATATDGSGVYGEKKITIIK